MLFDLPHILYMVITGIVTIFFLVLFRFVCKKENQKNLILKLTAVITVVLHFSSLYVNFFKSGQATIEAPMLLPIYPCNVAMWLLIICAFWKNKKSKVFVFIAEFTFYLGVVGSVLGIMFNEIYASTPNLADWHTLKGLLSHSVMLIGCIFLLTGGYIKIRVKNVLSVCAGLIFLLIDGGIIIGLYKIFKLDPPNCMYMLEPPLPSLPWINTYLIGVLALIVLFIITAIVEQIALPKEDRWYTKLKNIKNKKEIKK